MSQVVEEVLSVGAWAEVKVLPGRLDRARQRLTLTPKGTDLLLAQYRNHHEPDHLYIPRAMVGRSGPPIEGAWEELDLISNWSPVSRPGQAETLNDFMQALDDNAPYGGVIQAVTGAGKTVMAIELACRLNLKTLIVVPRDSLFLQWKKQIMKWTNCPEEGIGFLRGGRRDYDGKKFVVAMIHTLAQQYPHYEKGLFSEFGTVIFDECHVVGAETFSATAPLFRSKYRIGLSATPRRYDGMAKVFNWHIGPIVAQFTELQAKPRIRIFNYRGEDTGHRGCAYNGNLMLGRYINRIARSADRRRLVSRLVYTLYDKGHDILVLSDRIEQLNGIALDLKAQGVPHDDIGFLIGNTKQLEKKIILGTYGSAGMGVDIPRLTALVLATPRSDVEQAVGRVLRQGTPIVVDIVDTASSFMKNWARAREGFYRKISKDIERSS